MDINSGFAWIIMADVSFTAQRKLLVWNYQQGGSTSTSRIRPGASSEVYQFNMPGAVSDRLLGNNLVTIAPPSDQRTSYGVIAISPFGQLRYWSRLSEPHRCTDASIPLSADEVCSTLRSVPGAGYYILGTSTGRLILISLQGTHVVMQREIRASSSVLRTVGSWLGFGSKNTEPVDAVDQLVGIRVTSHSGFSLLWVLKANALNVWLLQPGRPESLVLNTNLINAFERSLQEANEQQYGTQIPLDFTICDFQVQIGSDDSQGILVLLVGTESRQTDINEEYMQESPVMEFHLATYEFDVRISGNGSATNIKQTLVATSLLPEIGPEYPSLTLPLDQQVACIHWNQFALCTPISGSAETIGTDILDVTRNPSHCIFGSAAISDAALYFTPAHGILKLQTTALLTESAAESSNRAANAGSSAGSATAGFMAQASAHDILAEAFHRYMSQSSSQHLSSPSPSYPWSSLVDTLWKLDYESAIESFSQQIADSRPAEDPRWPEYSARMNGGKSDIDSSYNSMLHALLCRQIEDKQELHHNFVSFLNEVGLWDQLSLNVKDSLEQTAERFASAVQLRAKHNECIQRQHATSGPTPSLSGNFSIFQQAIETSLISSGTSRAQWERSGLSAQDIYYAKVSNIESILSPALAALKSQLSTKLSLEAQCQLITQTNDIFQSVFSSAILARSRLAGDYYGVENQNPEELEPEFVRALAAVEFNLEAPWTRTHNHLLREVIRIARQFAEQVQQSKGSNASTGRSLGSGFSTSAIDVDLDLLHDQLFYLTDALLSDWYQETIRCESKEPSAFAEIEKQYIALRSELLNHFKSLPSQYELGLQLAQKYREFLVIVEICELQNDDAKLWKYASQFAHYGFERVIFEFYYVNKQYFKLLTPPRAYWKHLREYLDSTGANAIAWNHLIRTGDFKAAEETFDTLAEGELNSAFNQNTLLSLAKLSQLASGTPVDQVSVEREQRLYLRDAQRSVRAILDRTDDDATPVSAGTVITRLIEVARGTDDLQPGDSLQLALDLFCNTNWLRSEIENRELLHVIWDSILSFEEWPVLASALQRGDIDDDTLHENVQASLFFSVGMNSKEITEALPVNVFLSVVQSLYGDNPSVLRILGDAFDLLYRTKGASPPDLSPLFVESSSDAPLATEDDDDDDNGTMQS